MKLAITASAFFLVAVAEDACMTKDMAHRAAIHTKLAMMGVECEDLCKRMGIYPDGCQCAGFAGQPADDSDTRACFEKNCQDPKNKCPNDEFVTCVKTTTAVSALQWPSLLQRFDRALQIPQKAAALVAIRAHVGTELVMNATSCEAVDHQIRSEIQARVAIMGVECEEMCKKMNIYPDGCQCAGFAGQPASDTDTRACFTKHCQDPKNKCPNDEFVTCVKTVTAVLVQWPTLLMRMTRRIKEMHKMIVA